MKNPNEMSKAEMEQEISFAKEFVNNGGCMNKEQWARIFWSYLECGDQKPCFTIKLVEDENWRDDLRCGGQEEYDTQYSAASLYEGGWRASDLPDLIEQYNLTSEEANRIYDELLQIEQSAQSKED